MRRALVTFAALFLAVSADARILPAGGPTASSFAQLLATMPADSWQKLDAGTGNGQIYNLIVSQVDGNGAHGFTMCNYDGLPPSTCPGGSGSGDFKTTDAAVAANADGGSGVDPTSSGPMAAFSSAAIRPTDGKLVLMNTGGHAGSVTSAVFTFDAKAAAAACAGAGGYGCTPAGVWSMPVKPARYINNTNSKPTWSPQPNGSGTWWVTTNPDGKQMPISCHLYWANQWLGGDLWTQGGSYGCNVSGSPNLDTSSSGGIALFNSNTGAYTFPLIPTGGSSGVTFAQTTSNLAATMVAYDGLSGNGCIFAPHDLILSKWCPPFNASTTISNVGNASGVTGAQGIQPFSAGAIMPDPVTGGSAYMFFTFLSGANEGCGNFVIGQDSVRHPPGSAIWPNPSAAGCFVVWTDIYGSPRMWLAQFSGTMPAIFEQNGEGFAGMCWSATASKLLLYRGDGNIYQLNTAAGMNGLYDPTTGISSWTVSLRSSGAGGAKPSAPAGQTFSNCVALNGLAAEIVYVSGATNNDVYIHKD